MKKKFIETITAMIVSCVLLLSGTGAMAQTATTGTIEGTVTDASGGVVPGAIVTVTSPNLIRAQSATTNSDGRYRIANLPPGRYAVSVESTKGFGKYERTDVDVNLSSTSTVEIQLQPQGASEKVTITATSGDVIDANSNTTGTNVSSEQFSNFPTQRTVQSLYTIAPTVSRSGLRDASGRDRDPSVAGSSGPENNYILDGLTTSDPAFGGSGANLPFEFVQEVEIKTGAFGAEYGKATGGIFNVITKSGGNSFHGDIFTYFSTKGMVRDTKNFPFTGAAPNGFSEVDAGFDLGGPIIKDKLWFFGAFNPQRRKNFFFTQTFRDQVSSKVVTPFYAGKLSYGINKDNTFSFSTFGDFTNQENFLFGGAPNDAFTGFGADPASFTGTRETGGHNYAFRLNSTLNERWIAEFSFGMHFQRANIRPDEGLLQTPLVTDNFAILTSSNTIAPVTNTNISDSRGFIAFIKSPGGSLQRNFVRQGFGLFSDQDRNRYEFAAKLSNVFGPHTFKYGFEFNRNIYNIDTASSGSAVTFGNPLGLTLVNGSDVNQTEGFRATNNFSVCTTRGSQIVCPSSTAAARAALIAGAAGFSGAINAPITAAEANNNPFLVLSSTRVRDFQLHGRTYTNTQS